MPIRKLHNSSDQACTDTEGCDETLMVPSNLGRFPGRYLTRWRGFGLKRSLWRMGTVIASTSVVTFALLYVAEPTSSALTLIARDGGSAPAGSVVLYGTVRNASNPVEGAQITVSNDSSGKSHGHGNSGKGQIVGSESTDAQGTYRLQLFISPGEYTVDISLANGTPHGHFQFQVAGTSPTSSANSEGSNANGVGAQTAAFFSSNRFQSSHGDNGGPGNGSRGQSNQGNQNGGGFDTDDFPFPGNHFATVTGNQVLNLVPGIAYDVSAVITTSNFLSFLPVSSY